MSTTPADGSPRREVSTHSRRQEGKWILFAALVAFLPIPFFVPFWAFALVPISYLLLSIGRVGVIGAGYAVLVSPIVFVLAVVLARFILRGRTRTTRTAILAAIVTGLGILSLFPIYKPGLDPPRPAVNIFKLFQHGIPVGQ